MSEIVDLNAARKRRQKTSPYSITEDNLDGSPWPPDGNDDWRMVYRACGLTVWRRLSQKILCNAQHRGGGTNEIRLSDE